MNAAGAAWRRTEEVLVRVRTPAALIGALAGALLLAGCAGDPGAAAVVDGRSISRAEVEGAQADLTEISGSAPAGQVLMALVVAPLFIQAATDQGVGASAEEARGLLEQSAEQSGRTDAVFADSTVEIIRMSLSVQNLGGLPDGQQMIDEINAQVLELDVDVNPRYGEANLVTGSVDPVTRPWITSPAPADQ